MTMISKHLIFFIFHKNPVTKIVFLYFKLFVINYTDHERLRKELISDLESIIIMRSNKHFCEVSFKFVCLFVYLFVCLFVPLENFSLIWSHQYQLRASKFDLCSTLVAILSSEGLLACHTCKRNLFIIHI